MKRPWVKPGERVIVCLRALSEQRDVMGEILRDEYGLTDAQVNYIAGGWRMTEAAQAEADRVLARLREVYRGVYATIQWLDTGAVVYRFHLSDREFMAVTECMLTSSDFDVTRLLLDVTSECPRWTIAAIRRTDPICSDGGACHFCGLGLDENGEQAHDDACLWVRFKEAEGGLMSAVDLFAARYEKIKAGHS